MPTLGRTSRSAAALSRSVPVLAVVVGVATGLGAVVFRSMIELFTTAATGVADYAAHPGAAHPWFPALGPFFVVAAPVAAGLLYGPLVHRFAPETRGGGVPEVMLAVARHGGRIRPRVVVVKALASSLCIGGGGSVGRDGPIVHIGAAMGSTLAQWLRLDERRMRLLVACGAAGGVAATFNAPLAGVFFAMELVLRRWATEAFGVVVLSSVTASVVGRGLLGDDPFLTLDAISVDSLAAYPLSAVLGVVAGVFAVGFTRTVYGVETLCDRLWRGPEWLRPAVGGLPLGLLLLALPQMYGVGYSVLGAAVGGGYGIAFLMVLLVGKVLATSLTIGIGGSGGVFAPTLFCGAMLGAAVGQGAGLLAPGAAGSPGAYALVGMAAVFGGGARAPITAVVVVFELTGEYSLILPLMLAVVLASAVSGAITRETVYTAKLLRRGIDIDEPADSTLRRRPVGSFAVPIAPPVAAGTDLRDVAAALVTSGQPCLPVLDRDGRHAGLLDASTLMNALAAAEPADVLDLVERGEPLEEGAPVGEALRRLEDGAPAVAVVDADGSVTRWVRERDVLAALSTHQEAEPDPRARAEPPPSGVTRRAGRPSAGT